jgi:hypothetical protein
MKIHKENNTTNTRRKRYNSPKIKKLMIKETAWGHPWPCHPGGGHPECS